jgi:nucleolar protein 15
VSGDVAGVVYVGHVPHGFYEKQMRGFFAQFGEVTRVRLSRSKKTARSRGFAFVEFANAEVARISAGAMDGYLMHGRALVAKFVAPEEVHPATFDGANRVFRRIPWASIERERNLEAARDPEKLAERAARVAAQHKKTQEKLAALGISYKFPAIPVVARPAKIVAEGDAAADAGAAGGKGASKVRRKAKTVEKVDATAMLDDDATAMLDDDATADAEVEPMDATKAKATPKAKTPKAKSARKAKAVQEVEGVMVNEEVADKAAEADGPAATLKPPNARASKAKTPKAKSAAKGKAAKEADAIVNAIDEVTEPAEKPKAKTPKSKTPKAKIPKATTSKANSAAKVQATEEVDRMAVTVEEVAELAEMPKTKMSKAKSPKAKSARKPKGAEDEEDAMMDREDASEPAATPKVKTPTAKAKTPMAKAKTPMAKAKTPMAKAKTPNTKSTSNVKEAAAAWGDAPAAAADPAAAKATPKAKSARKAKPAAAAGDDEVMTDVVTPKAKSAVKTKATPTNRARASVSARK